MLLFPIMQGDFMKMSFPDNTYDAVYAIEATCHAPDAVCDYIYIYIFGINCCDMFLISCTHS